MVQPNQEVILGQSSNTEENSNKSNIESDLIYGLDANPPFLEAIFVALQHVFACFVGSEYLFYNGLSMSKQRKNSCLKPFYRNLI